MRKISRRTRRYNKPQRAPCRAGRVQLAQASGQAVDNDGVGEGSQRGGDGILETGGDVQEGRDLAEHAGARLTRNGSVYGPAADVAAVWPDLVDGGLRAREERWIDPFENVGKSSGAYSWGTYDSHPYVLMNYKPGLDSLLTIAHEMGHSMHSYYSNHTQPYTDSGYSLFVAEVASTTNEVLVLLELMERYQGNDKAQAYLIAQLLENFRTTVFRQTMFAEFERESHAMAERGEPLTVETLNGVYGRLNAEYYTAVKQDPLIAYEWMRIPHFYRAFYVYKYATGFSAAMALATGIRKEGAPAVARYKKFLSLGGSMHPIDLLKVAGVDMSDPASVETALSAFDELVRKYLELTKKA